MIYICRSFFHSLKHKTKMDWETTVNLASVAPPPSQAAAVELWSFLNKYSLSVTLLNVVPMLLQLLGCRSYSDSSICFRDTTTDGAEHRLFWHSKCSIFRVIKELSTFIVPILLKNCLQRIFIYFKVKSPIFLLGSR